MIQLVITPLILALLGVGLAFVPRLRGVSYCITSLSISVAGFLVLFWRDLPFGTTLASPEGPLALAIYHLLPFFVLFFAPLCVGYFSTRSIRRRYSRDASVI